MTSVTLYYNLTQIENVKYQASHRDWKIWKMGDHFAMREKSRNFNQSGKVWELGILPKILEKYGKWFN